MSALHWLLWDAPPPPAVPARTVTVRGRADTALSVAGRDDTAIAVRGGHIVPVKQDIEFYRGEAVRITDVMEGETSLTGRTFRLAIKNATGTLLLALGVGSGITLDSPAGGSLACALTAVQTTALAVGRHSWGVAETTSGSETVLTYGQCAVLSAAPLPAS